MGWIKSSPDAPEPCGKEFDLCMYFDSDHAEDKETRISRTFFKIQMNKALAQWLSKKQPKIETIENSVFGAKFLAIKIGMKTLQGLRYKLRMMGIPLSCLSLLCGDNISVIHNTQILDYTLRKKRNSICYHSI